jgi:hypothetical protein
VLRNFEPSITEENVEAPPFEDILGVRGVCIADPLKSILNLKNSSPVI